MLDAYIIDRIRRERDEARRQTQVPLHIERPPPEAPVPEGPRPSDDREPDRGSIVIDFHL